MRVCFVPIDIRPVCYNLARDICSIDKDIRLFLPPREYMGDLKKYADTESIFLWLEQLPQTDCMILSLDTLAYGGLIPSRRVTDNIEQIKQRIERLKPLLKNQRVLAFSSIMRISNNNYNEEEKLYWKEYGKKIFEYSYSKHKGDSVTTDVPKEILNDYLATRQRNFEINKFYLELQSEGLFDTLIFSKDDCAPFGFNVQEAQELERLGGMVKTGADEIPLTLLARAIQKDIKIYPKFIEDKYKNCISNYEDISIEQSVKGQLGLGGFKIAESENDADIVLIVNNFIEKQGEHVMGWDTLSYSGILEIPSKPFAVADVRYANGADNAFIEALFKDPLPQYGYAAWNTSANTIGSLIAGIKVKYNAKLYDDNAFKKLQLIRYLDDWAYQANVRKQIKTPSDIASQMKPFEDRILKKLSLRECNDIKYSFPWHRTFEIEVSV